MALGSWTRFKGSISGSANKSLDFGYEWMVVDNADRITNNRSTVKVRMWLYRKNTTWQTYDLYDRTSNITIDGNPENQTTRYDTRNLLNLTRKYCGLDTDVFPKGVVREHVVNHNTDGTKTCVISATLATAVASMGTVRASSTVPLPTIPRASSVTATNADIESATSININRYSTAFTHTLRYAFGGLSETIATGVLTSYGWTIPSTFYVEIPNIISGTCTIYCDTYNGATLIGTTSTTFTVSVNSTANKPNVSATIIDSNTNTVALTGNDQSFIKFISNASFSITATAKNNATIVSRKIICGNLSSASASGVLNGVESGIFIVEATDSRGITNSVTYEKTLIEYVKLTLNANIYRTQPTNNQIAMVYSGNYYNDSFGSQSNTLTVKWRYKEVEGNWTDYAPLTPTITNNTFNNGENPIILADNFDYKKRYIFEIVVQDKIYDYVIFEKVVPKGKPSLAIFKDSARFEGDIYLPLGAKITTFDDTGIVTEQGVFSNFQFHSGVMHSCGHEFMYMMGNFRKQPLEIAVKIPTNFTITEAKVTIYHAPIKWYNDMEGRSGWGYARKLKLYKDNTTNYYPEAVVMGTFLPPTPTSTEITGAFGTNGYTPSIPSEANHNLEETTSIDIKSNLSSGLTLLRIQPSDSITSEPGIEEDETALKNSGWCWAVINVFGFQK